MKWINEHNINLLKHPACFPDLNLIENVWMDVKRRLKSLPKQPQNFEELKQAIKEEWYKTSLCFIRNLYNTMPRRIESLIKAKDSFTKY